jgi:HD-GYP domain-containing protein (c-di-GMP phosphodiesterase class II)
MPLDVAGFAPDEVVRAWSQAPSGSPAQVPLGHVLGALSHALDLTEGQPAGHCMRACWIGLAVGRRIGLSDPSIGDLFYTILLKDLGCSSNAARIAQLYLTDDLRFKADSKLLADGPAPALRFILQHTGGGSGFIDRLRATWQVVRNAGAIVQDLITTRCERGASIAQRLRFSATVVEGVRSLDEHWNGAGRPEGLRGHEIPIQARIALLAQVADVFAVAAGPQAARDEIRARGGAWFDPALVDAFDAVARDRRFWEMHGSSDLERALLDLEPAQRMVAADDVFLDDIAKAFAEIIDAKSPYTHGHSARVARFAEDIGAEMGFDPFALKRLRRAALLHDLGKLGVSNKILDKPGKLEPAEWRAVRMHPVHSRRILSRISILGDCAEIGGSHHERLDGRGYPRGIVAGEINLATRVVSAADVYDALTAARPYRAAMPAEKALGVMEQDRGTVFDPACLRALERLADATSTDRASA